MSKSYDNVVPLFEGGLEGLKGAIARVVTDSRLPGEPKDPEGTTFIQLWDSFASREQRAAMRAELQAGLAWGEAKQRLVTLIDAELGPMRARYEPWACAVRACCPGVQRPRHPRRPWCRWPSSTARPMASSTSS